MRLCQFSSVTAPVLMNTRWVQYAVDTSGQLWIRTYDLQVENISDWIKDQMPERQQPKSAWEQLLEAQERLREQGRDIEVVEHGAEGEAPQSIRLTKQ